MYGLEPYSETPSVEARLPSLQSCGDGFVLQPGRTTTRACEMNKSAWPSCVGGSPWLSNTPYGEIGWLVSKEKGPRREPQETRRGPPPHQNLIQLAVCRRGPPHSCCNAPTRLKRLLGPRTPVCSNPNSTSLYRDMLGNKPGEPGLR